jgi:methylated-DNA-[protein]-cysteine S-methyltransferase
MTLYASVIDTPVGNLLALVRADGVLVALPFLTEGDDPAIVAARHGGGATIDFEGGVRNAHIAVQLDEYFRRQRTTFDVETETQGYAELARRIGSPSASRAVGRANGANPIPIVIPCHRVIGANGDLTGYGGGLDRKRTLLRLEGALTEALELAGG